MAKFKPVRAYSTTFDSVPRVKGQVIFLEDTGQIAWDATDTKRIISTAGMLVINISIPTSAWVADATFTRFPYRAEVYHADVTETHYASVSIDDASQNAAYNCGFCPTVKTTDTKLLFYAQKIPDDTITGVCCLWPQGVGTASSQDSSTQSVVLETAAYSGNGISAVVRMEYDATNMSTDANTSSDGTLVVEETGV